MDYDCIIIGAGPGGYETALKAAKSGMKTALIEEDELGGTCLNRGCIPTKTLLHSLAVYDYLKNKGEESGFTGIEGIGINIARLQDEKTQVVKSLRDGVEKLLKSSKIDIYKGKGSIISRNKVRVTANDGKETILSSSHIIIATGSKPERLKNLEGSRLSGVITSDEILDTDSSVKSLVILGGGVIGMEIADVFCSLGTKVTILKSSSKIFNGMDKEAGTGLKAIFKKRGIDIISDVEVLEISKDENNNEEALKVRYCKKSDTKKEEILNASKVLIAKGRIANTEGLIDKDADKEIKNIVMDGRGFISVNEKFETSVPGIFAIGDVIKSKNLPHHAQLAHVATAEGRNCIDIINNKGACTDLNVVPSCIYTNPEIAETGLNVDRAEEKGMKVVSKKYPMGANAKSFLSKAERGFIKVVYDEDTKRLIGATMMCERATDMISMFSQAILNGLTTDDLAHLMYPHPTVSEAVGELVKSI